MIVYKLQLQCVNVVGKLVIVSGSVRSIEFGIVQCSFVFPLNSIPTVNFCRDPLLSWTACWSSNCYLMEIQMTSVSKASIDLQPINLFSSSPCLFKYDEGISHIFSRSNLQVIHTQNIHTVFMLSLHALTFAQSLFFFQRSRLGEFPQEKIRRRFFIIYIL